MSEKKTVQRRLPFRPRSLRARREHAETIVERLAELYPDSHCALDHSNAFELLTATVLSAQTTDARVNSVTPTLFENFPDPQSMATAPLPVLEDILHPLGFYRSKARSINGLANGLLQRFDGEVPGNLDDLVTLPGVGRKTANVVLGNAFDIPGITVDTHVGRLSRRWAWTRETDPVKAEADLAKILPQSQWTIICHRVIDHGRQVCHSRKPACGTCPMADICPSFELEIG
ncbi:endonuclease III [Arcanobacterium phocisimile]|uniref:Endonuclease III n=1 Tax=Arcanobacterium phocisimile TaxID=1302235 RepID=A0ABX7IGE4_9ACTO|nr:endonuclease III [Arcanobacterium phocisimile]QRV02092.1 endonuclease III [Arcanobacterium phocisimile]